MADSANWRIRSPAAADDEPRRSNNGSRANRSTNDSRQPIVSLAERSRSDDLKVHRPQRQHEDSPDTANAISEGRRIYLGNLLYSTTVQDIEAFLADNGFSVVENIHISVDKFTGRNPGYCFIEFAEKATADEAMEKLEGVSMFDRPVKCRPCQPKGNQRQASRWGGRDDASSSNYNRWGNWGRSGAESAGMAPRDDSRQSIRHGQVSRAQEEGRQLYVGGLPRMLDQAENENEIRSIFKDFEVDGVSKRVSPRESSEPQAGRRNFCFVDFKTREEAQAAKIAINGINYRDAPLKVSEAVPKSDRYANKSQWADKGVQA